MIVFGLVAWRRFSDKPVIARMFQFVLKFAVICHYLMHVMSTAAGDFVPNPPYFRNDFIGHLHRLRLDSSEA